MISIIIPACDEEKYILETIDSIRKQTFKDYEIIVVCNGCNDKTFEVVKDKADKVFNFEWRNIAKARNVGAKVAKGDKLVFLDADTKLIGNVLDKINTSDFYIGTCKFKPDTNEPKHKLFSQLKSNLFSPLLGISNGIIFCNKKDFTSFNEGMKKGEEGNMLRRMKRNGKFLVLDELVETSMRRYEKLGYINILFYWTKERLKPTNDDYSVIR